MNKLTLIKDWENISVVYRKIETVRITVDDIIMDKIKNWDIKEVQEYINERAAEIFDKE